MAVTLPDKNDDALIRAVVVVFTLVALLLVVYWALGWTPGGVLMNDKGVPIIDNGHPIPKPRQASDIVAMIGAVTTFLGTALGTYFGINAGARAGSQAVAAASQANQAAQNANASAANANSRATAATTDADQARDAKTQQDAAVRSLLSIVDASKPHVDANDAALGQQLTAEVESVRRTLT